MIAHWPWMLRHILIAITETAKLLLTSGIPSIKDNGTEVGVESQRMNLNTESSWNRRKTKNVTLHTDILLLELASQVTLDEGSLAGTTVANYRWGKNG
ncbi:hypothetical protein BC937DRAFT_91349 [Endogone sp. FLAS-F59071]|nr:hypothetical protein BC937DRAFT_91349 [Endogone sp. FLAS-F59071]|eukprot:RUS16325.1 hypothetical protein BC937DRAFT_91349 [Endogone sp. FLAS-F59071]